jgi:hypothetical protein
VAAAQQHQTLLVAVAPWLQRRKVKQMLVATD